MARKVRKAPRRRIGPVAWAAIGCGGVVGLGLIAGLLGLALAKSTPAPPVEAVDVPAADSQPTGATTRGSSPTAAAQGASTADVPPIEVQLQEVHAASRSSQPVPMRLVITEAALQALVSERAGEAIQDPRVYFGDGTVVTTGRVRWQGQDFHITVRGHVIAVNGDAELIVDEVMIGRLPAPAQLYGDASRRLNRGLDDLLARGRFYVESVQVQPSALVVTGRAGGRG